VAESIVMGVGGPFAPIITSKVFKGEKSPEENFPGPDKKSS